MQRILLGLGTIAVLGGLVVGGSGAFFSDTETSTGNTFTAGALDLKVDSTAHYNQMICTAGTPTEGNPLGLTWQPEEGFVPGPDHYPQPGTPCTGTWTESDLVNTLKYKFFNLTDVKPGDEGENTISLHVYDNDAWGCFLVDNVQDSDVTCTEPESEDADDASCTPAGNVAQGELGAALTFDAWLDQGAIPGFQNMDAEGNPVDSNTEQEGVQLPDPTEGDNFYQEIEGPKFWTGETVDSASEGPFAIKDVLAGAYTLANQDEENNCSATGNTNYQSCHGLAADGRMVGSVTYYFGLAWNIPDTVGNEIQTDNLIADLNFEVAQHRNNPQFSCTPSEVRTTLTLAKTVIPAEQEPDSSYTLIADGAVTDLSGIEGSSNVFFAPVQPGIYALSESGGDLAPHVASWSCTGNAIPEVDNNDGTASVTVGAGENVVCVVTNNYTPIN